MLIISVFLCFTLFHFVCYPEFRFFHRSACSQLYSSLLTSQGKAAGAHCHLVTLLDFQQTLFYFPCDSFTSLTESKPGSSTPTQRADRELPWINPGFYVQIVVAVTKFGALNVGPDF